MIPEIELNKYEIGNLIGSSVYSNVFKAVDKKTQKEYAFKFMTQFDIYTSDSIIALNLARTCNFKNVLKNYGYFYFHKFRDIPEFLKRYFICATHRKSDFFIIVNEFMPNGNLHDYINRHRKSKIKIESKFRYKILFGVAMIMKTLHLNHFFHRDLKMSHIFLDKNFEPRLSLCHFSKILSSEKVEQTPMIGTPMFIAPEIIKGGKYGLKADVYSFSIIMLNMFYSHAEFGDGYPLFSHAIYMKTLSGERFKRPVSASDAYWNLIQRCWKQDPNERPSFEEIIEILKSDEFIRGEFENQADVDDIREYVNKCEVNDIREEFSLSMSKLIDSCS